MEFYSAAAQVIPVLFLTFLIEGYVTAQKGLSGKEQALGIVQYLALIFVFVYGEYEALNVLATGEATSEQQNAVTSSMAVGTFIIVMPIVLQYARNLSVKAGQIVETIVFGLIVLVPVVVLGLIPLL